MGHPTQEADINAHPLALLALLPCAWIGARVVPAAATSGFSDDVPAFVGPPVPDDVGPASETTVGDDRRTHWLAPTKADVVALQPLRAETTVAGVTLVNLAPQVGRWFVLRDATRALHLEVPSGTAMTLDTAGGLLVDGVACDPWTARPTAEPWAPACDAHVWVRRTGDGRKTALERATDALRDHVIGGEELTVFVRDRILKDRYLRTVAIGTSTASSVRTVGAPRPARLSHPATLAPTDVGLVPADARATPLAAGEWHPIDGHPDTWFSLWTGELVPPDLLEAHKGSLIAPDAAEKSALAVMVAFDLAHFDLDYALGTDHPRVGWSERIPPEMIVAGLPGPDGFDTDAPLARTGQVPPWQRDAVEVVFTGGFKRSHAAFKVGEPAWSDRGTHYGFVEQGVVFSRPMPGLATVVVDTNGTVDLLTWTSREPEALANVLHLRQAGLPLVETGPDGAARPGDKVTRWAEGNWSGSAEGRLRALRAGLCLIEDGDRRTLVYGYFTGATPSLMSWAFLAYDCDYALLTDMNALEHTYLAFLDHGDTGHTPRHLDTGMSVLDVATGDQVQARFVDFADNRDFFTLTRRAER